MKALLLVFLVLHLPDDVAPCPPGCRCQRDEEHLQVDCSELALGSVPANLHPLTTYLDLSVNNISELRPHGFHRLQSLTELRLYGNNLRCIPELAFTGLQRLRVLLLQNNQLEYLPSESPWDLPNLLSLRLDANLLHDVPERPMSGLHSLRHLWLDDNALTEVPATALSHLRTLQALTLALNHIRHIPNYAFHNLSGLVVLHLQNNRIQTMGPDCFEGLQSLEMLDFNNNNLLEFPAAIRNLPKLQELGIHNNKIRAIPEQAFESNSLLHTINFNGNLIHFVGRSAFQNLPKLHTLNLKQNLLQEIGARTFQYLGSLHILDLSNNFIKIIDKEAFTSLYHLTELDMSENQLTSLHLGVLPSLSHLKLKGNLGLKELIRKDDLPNIHIIQMPYAYQCCAYDTCNDDNPASQRDDQNREEIHEDPHKQIIALLSLHKGTHYELDLEEFPLQLRDGPNQTRIQCTPVPGPYKPCIYLFDCWTIRMGVWTISASSIVCNSLLVFTLFATPAALSPVKLLIGLIGGANLLTGLTLGTLALVDAVTFGEFYKHGAQWESSAGCQITHTISLFAAEASILYLSLAVTQCGLSEPCKTPYLKNVKLASLCCTALSFLIAMVPLMIAGGFRPSALCMTSPVLEKQQFLPAFMVGLIIGNSFCLLVTAGTYIKLYWSLTKRKMDCSYDGTTVRHLAQLVFIDCLLYCCVAFLFISSLFGIFRISNVTVKVVQLLLMPLPASLNPIIYLLLNPCFKKEILLLKKLFQPKLEEMRDLLVSGDSTQALGALSSSDLLTEELSSLSKQP